MSKVVGLGKDVRREESLEGGKLKVTALVCVGNVESLNKFNGHRTGRFGV